ncbi:S-adenosyl-L-methionine-dependent methyltransferase, partial [Saccharata proteae CBS 121410]
LVETYSGSETTSLASTLYRYPVENGRRYHKYKEGEYWGPNDDQQNDQLDILHQIYLLLLDGKLFLAPIPDTPQKVLDVGTGTGLWAIDFADKYPSAQVVIGTDLSPIQPKWVPPNLQFEVEDAAEEWTYHPGTFDFIHVRGFYGCIRDWPAFYQQVLQNLKPGAWFEQVEYSVTWVSDDGTVPDDHVFKEWSDIFEEAGERIGKTFRIWAMQKELMLENGFAEVTEHRYKMPVGPWSSDPKLKEVGRWHLLECFQGIEGWAMALLTRVMGWSLEEVHVFLARVRAGLKDRKVHAYTSV